MNNIFNWSTTASGFDWDTIAAIASAIATIATVVVTIIIACSQGKREKQAQKIALFDKRYKIYEETLRLFGFSKFVLEEDKQKELSNTVPNYLMIAYMVIEEYNLMSGKDYILERSRLQRTVQEKGGEEGHKADRDLYYLENFAHTELLQLKQQSLNAIKPSLFCFDKDICNMLNKYVEELFSYIAIFKNGTAQEKPRNISSLQEIIKKIEDKKIIEKMERYLSINK